MIEQLLSVYEEHYENLPHTHELLRAANFDLSPSHSIPHANEDKFTIDACDGYYTLSFGFSRLVLPTTLSSPKELVQAYMETVGRLKQVTSVPYPYAKGLASAGYKVDLTKGIHQYVYSTKHLIDLQSGGRRYRELRRFKRKHMNEGITFRLLTANDAGNISSVEKSWVHEQKEESNAHRKRLWRQQNATLFWRQLKNLPKAMRTRGVGAFLGDEMMAFAIGCILTPTHWSCPYSHGTKAYASLMNLCWLELAHLYSDIPYEIDGEGGMTGLNWNKNFYLSEDVMDDQIHVFNVGKA